MYVFDLRPPWVELYKVLARKHERDGSYDIRSTRSLNDTLNRISLDDDAILA
jgi:hypothetical protein